MASELYKYRNRIDYLKDFPGANVAEGTILAEVANTINTDLNEPLDASGAVITVTDDGDLKIYDSSGNVIEEPLDVSGATVTVQEDQSAVTTQLASAADISGGVSASLSKRNYTLYLGNTGAASADVTISYSPDGGTSYFDDPDGVITVASGATQMVEIGYEATNIQVTASNTEPFNVHVVER